MLRPMVVAKSTGSWLTNPTWLRSHDSGTAFISVLSNRTCSQVETVAGRSQYAEPALYQI